MIKSTWRLVLGSVAALAMAVGAVQAQQVTIAPINATGTPGQEVDFEISYTGPINANGITFNILYGSSISAAFTPIFKPTTQTKNIECTTEADLADLGIKTAAVVFTPAGASAPEIGFTVIGLDTVTGPIAFGRTGTLGKCKFTVAPTASGVTPLTCDTAPGATTASDVTGANLPATCTNGTLTIPVEAVVNIGPITATGAPGQEVDFDISFTGPANTNGITFNVLYGSAISAAFTPIFKPTTQTKNIDCTTASDLADLGIKTAAVVFTPAGASAPEIGFTVIGLDTVTGPIPFGRNGTLGTCKFTVASTASGVTPLTCDTAPGATTASDVTGANLSAACHDGTLTIGAVVTPATFTPTPTVPPVVTPTTPAVTPKTSTPTPTATKNIPVGGATQEDEGGCQIGTASQSSSSGWLVLVPALGLLVMRRRRR